MPYAHPVLDPAVAMADDQRQRPPEGGERSAAQPRPEAPRPSGTEDLRRFSPDPYGRTDRYSLVTPFESAL
jgi:hypothetical protein